MGTALIHGWIGANLLKRADILDPHLDSSVIHNAPMNFQSLFHVKRAADMDLQESDIVILAVKPQIMTQLCTNLKDKLPANIPVLSIAAGKNTSYFTEHLGADTPLIRAMPNTPAAIGQGISALYATNNVTDAQKAIAEALLSAVGQTLWLDNEDLMDAVTALSGSGPAYLFYMIEVMALAGTKVGLSENQSMQLARQTVIGSAALAQAEPDLSAATLRQNVTSPAGTTEAALEILMDGKFQDIMDKTIQAATNRGKELAS